jgi:hypothetical protein
LLTTGEETKDLFANVRNEYFRVATAHPGLADERCRYIYNVRDFPRSLRLVYDLFGRRHHERRPLLYETAAH